MHVDIRSDGDDSSSTVRMNSMEHFRTHAMKGYVPARVASFDQRHIAAKSLCMM